MGCAAPALGLSPAACPLITWTHLHGPKFLQAPRAGPLPRPGRNREQKFLFALLPLLGAARLRTRAAAGRVARAAAPRRRNPTSPRLRPPLASQPGAQGSALLGALSPQGGDPKASCSRAGKKNWDPRAAVLVPCPLEFQGRAWVSGGRWKADDQWGRLVLRIPYLFWGGRIARMRVTCGARQDEGDHTAQGPSTRADMPGLCSCSPLSFSLPCSLKNLNLKYLSH